METNNPLEPENELAALIKQAVRARNFAAEHRRVAAGIKDRSYSREEFGLAQFYEQQAREIDDRIRALTSHSPKL